MRRDVIHIDWDYSGTPDGLAGTGATTTEKGLLWGATAASTVLLVTGQLVRSDVDWTAWQWALFVFVALDIAGGVTANTLNSCKRLYLSPASEADSPGIRRMKNPWLFTSLHVHTIAIALLFPNTSIVAGCFWYAALLACVAATLRAPLYLRRPTAFFLIVMAIGISLYFVPLGLGFEWLVPLLFLKIVYGHTVREEPYRPSTEV